MSTTSNSENWVFATQGKYKPEDLTACVFYACRFLALKLPATSENTFQIMNMPYKENSDPVSTLLQFKDDFEVFRNVPYMIDTRSLDYFGVDAEKADNNFMLVEVNPDAYIKLLRLIENTAAINGAVIAKDHIAIGMRKSEEGTLDFFDPHGAEEFTKQKAPYIKKCKTHEEAEEYLILRFPSEPEGGELLQPLTVWPIQYKI